MNNIDQHEIAKFDAIANEWWDLQGKFKPLHQINPARLGFIQQHITLTNKTAIDVGCGGGILTEAIANAGAKTIGIDMSNQALSIAKQHAESQKLTIQYQQITAENAAEKYPEQFDVVSCMELLEHVPDPAAIVKACAKLCKPNGYVFFSTINRNLKAYLFAIVAAEYILKLLPKATHDYQKFIRPAELANLCRQAELELNTIKGINYNPLLNKVSLNEDVSINYIVCCQKRI